MFYNIIYTARLSKFDGTSKEFNLEGPNESKFEEIIQV